MSWQLQAVQADCFQSLHTFSCFLLQFTFLPYFCLNFTNCICFECIAGVYGFKLMTVHFKLTKYLFKIIIKFRFSFSILLFYIWKKVTFFVIYITKNMRTLLYHIALYIHIYTGYKYHITLVVKRYIVCVFTNIFLNWLYLSSMFYLYLHEL